MNAAARLITSQSSDHQAPSLKLSSRPRAKSGGRRAGRRRARPRAPRTAATLFRSTAPYWRSTSQRALTDSSLGPVFTPLLVGLLLLRLGWGSGAAPRRRPAPGARRSPRRAGLAAAGSSVDRPGVLGRADRLRRADVRELDRRRRRRPLEAANLVTRVLGHVELEIGGQAGSMPSSLPTYASKLGSSTTSSIWSFCSSVSAGGACCPIWPPSFAASWTTVFRSSSTFVTSSLPGRASSRRPRPPRRPPPPRRPSTRVGGHPGSRRGRVALLVSAGGEPTGSAARPSPGSPHGRFPWNPTKRGRQWTSSWR